MPDELQNESEEDGAKDGAAETGQGSDVHVSPETGTGEVTTEEAT